MLGFWCFSSAAAPRLSSRGVILPGCDTVSDAGFDLLDWNGDGKLDFILASPSMTSFYGWVNEGSPTQPKFGHALWYPLNMTETEPYGMYFTQSFAVCDLNHDGLFDLVVFDGQLRMIDNTGTAQGPNHWNLALPAPYFPGSPQMIKENSRLTITPETMYWGKGVFPREVLTLTVADWDGDGLEDLIICRFKDQAPGVKPASRPNSDALGASSRLQESTWNEKLTQTPARALYFYKNLGTREKPWFDQGVEITTPDGKSIDAPNPVVVDLDGDGNLGIVSSETPYACNAYRVDWPTRPSIVWFRRPKKEDETHLEPARPLLDAAQKPIPAGVQARFADFRGVGVKDLFVLDPGKGIRWYQNTAKSPRDKSAFAAPTVIQGNDFARFYFMVQPLVANWYGPKSRDLILHGLYDAHCQMGYRRTAVYRNVATQPGQIKYEFGGFFNYRGDPAMVPQKFPFEDQGADVYGTYVAVMPDDGTGKKRLVMSVSGKLYLFSNLAADGLTFQERKPLNIPNPNHNHLQGWQEIPVHQPDKVRYIRLSVNNAEHLNIVNFEAIAAGTNWATVAAGAQVQQGQGAPQNPVAMLTPGNQISDTWPNFTTINSGPAPAVIILKEPVALEKIRFLLADRDQGWYSSFWPFSWQGKPVREYTPEIGEMWYHYKVEVSSDQTNWTVAADRLKTERFRSCPVFVDWNHDGKFDLVLGVLNATGNTPLEKEYRLYLNKGTNDDPKYDDDIPFGDENGKPLKLAAAPGNLVGPQCGVAVFDAGSNQFGLVTEDDGAETGLRYYQCASTDPTKDLRLKFIKKLGDPVPLEYPSGYRYFYFGDVDGDGIPDVLNSSSGEFAFFKGIPADAPAAVPMSDIAKIAMPLPPDLKQIVLRNGPAESPIAPAYKGTQACKVDAARPNQSFSNELEARALSPFSSQKQRMILIRFNDLPKLASLEQATLELTTAPQHELQGMVNAVEISCSAMRDDWDPAKATFLQAAPGKPWATRELDAGGEFLSRAPAIWEVRPQQTLTWDVTKAVREASQAGRTSVNLLVRAEYTGKYVGGVGYNFCGPDFPKIEDRPRLRLISK